MAYSRGIYEKDELIEILACAMVILKKHNLPHTTYKKFAKEREIPSGTVIANKVGSWRGALLLAQKFLQKNKHIDVELAEAKIAHSNRTTDENLSKLQRFSLRLDKDLVAQVKEHAEKNCIPYVWFINSLIEEFEANKKLKEKITAQLKARIIT